MSKVGSVTQARYNSIDTRKNIYEFDSLPEYEKNAHYPDLDKIKTNALAVACLMTSSEIIETELNYVFSSRVGNLSDRVSNKYMDDEIPPKFNAPLAPNEKFRDELAPGFGSAFLIRRKKIMTAGHCVCPNDSPKLMSKEWMDTVRVVFRFHKTQSNQDKRIFDKDDVYKIKKVVSYNFNPNSRIESDWAIIKLDRPVDIKIKSLEFNYFPSEGSEIYALGCPTGTAVKFAGPSRIRKINFQSQMKSDIDTFAGNSGCPIFDRATNKVIGILTRGFEDYEIDQAYLNTTGKRRVITKVITQEMIPPYGYSTIQKLKPYMTNRKLRIARSESKQRNPSIAKEGRKKRREYSDWHSSLFENQRREIINEEKIMRKIGIGTSFTIFAAPVCIATAVLADKKIKMLESELKKYEGVRNSYNNKINLLEASRIDESYDSSLSRKDKFRIVRSMIAYKITYIEAKYLVEIEYGMFNKKFSPNDVLCLSSYAMEKWVYYREDMAKKLLKILRDENRGYISSTSDRVKTVERIIATI